MYKGIRCCLLLLVLPLFQPMSEEEHNGPYFGYQIYYQKRDKTSYDYPYMYTVYDWKTNSMTAPVKQSYTPYIVKVQARNILGNALEEPTEYIMYTYEDSKYTLLMLSE